MILLACTAAWAGAFTLVDSGIRAQGRGGAFVAGADDVSAQLYNPAALVWSPGVVQVDAWGTQLWAGFDRTDVPGVNPFDPVENEAAPVFEPSLGVSGALGTLAPVLRDTVVAFGAWAPTGADLAFPAEGPQRYALQSLAIRQLYVGPSVAQRVTPWLSVGAGLQYSFLSVDQSLAATLCNAQEPESCGSDSPLDDVTLRVTGLDPAAFTGNVGVLLTPHEAVAIGVSWQAGTRFQAEGALTATFNDANATVRPSLTGSEFTDPDVRVEVELPWTARAGVQVMPSPTLRLELAATYSAWSETDAMRVTGMDLELTSLEDGPLKGDSLFVTDDVSLPTGFVDSGSLRLGAEWDASAAVCVRAGVFGETTATPSAMAGVQTIDGDKVGASVGAGVGFGAFRVEASALGTYFLDREVSDSTYAQTALAVDYGDGFQTTVTQGRTIGNGSYTAAALVGGLSASWRFGASP